MMSPPHSKQALQQIQAAAHLTSLVKTHKASMIAAMAESLDSFMTNEERLSFPLWQGAILDAMSRCLEDATAQMGDADLAHNQGLLDTQQARDNRDIILKDTFQKIASIKQFIEGVHGTEALTILGMAGETPRVPSDLESWLGKILHLLEQAPQLPPPCLPGLVSGGVETIYKSLAPIHAALCEALEQVRLQQVQDALTLECKRQQLEKHSQIYNAVVCMAEAHAYVNGDPKLLKLLCSRQPRRPIGPKNAHTKKNARDAAQLLQ